MSIDWCESVQRRDAGLRAAAQPAEGLGTKPHGCSKCCYRTEGCTACQPHWSKQRAANAEPVEPANEDQVHDCSAQSGAGDASGGQPSTLQPMPAPADTSLLEPVPAPEEAAALAPDTKDAALAVVQAAADPTALVDFPFNSRRGEPCAASCSTLSCCNAVVRLWQCFFDTSTCLYLGCHLLLSAGN